MTNNVRVRYAPSPTGHLHIGNARTALFNYLYARSLGGTFVIRIEDTDQKRNIEGGEQSQLEYLNWLGIEWDEGPDQGGAYGPYRQSERTELYQTYYEQLLAEKKAYKCYCTAEELEAEREDQQEKNEIAGYSGKCRHLTDEDRAALEAEGRRPSIRFLVRDGETIAFADMVKGDVSFDSDGIGGDFVIVKQDGTPTYNFAVAVDDHLMKMTHVLRGDDHISNTPKQLLIYKALGFTPPVFGHMTLIVNENRKKLSKRDESIIQFIEQYKELGYVPEALFNFITLLGWSPKEEQEIFTKEEFIQQFDAERLSKSPAFFDKQKLLWMNNQYMKEQPVERIVELARPHLVKAGLIEETLSPDQEEWVTSLIALFQEKLHFGAEITELTSSLFFQDEAVYEEEAKSVLAEEQVPEVLQAFAEKAASLEPFEADGVKKAMKEVQKETGHKGKKLFMPIRAAVTGQTHGPDLPKAIELLGREKVLKRLQAVLD